MLSSAIENSKQSRAAVRELTTLQQTDVYDLAPTLGASYITKARSEVPAKPGMMPARGWELELQA